MRLVVEGLHIGHIHELHANGLRSGSGETLVHEVGYYTLNEIPKVAESPAKN